jgi:AraC-like DNA-binding protein
LTVGSWQLSVTEAPLPTVNRQLPTVQRPAAPAVHVAQHLDLLFPLHSLGNDLQVQRAGEGGDGAHHLACSGTVASVAAVAAHVGYESEAAFSSAFKKTAGVPPSRWRTRVRAE